MSRIILVFVGIFILSTKAQSSNSEQLLFPIDNNFSEEVPLFENASLSLVLMESKFRILFSEIEYWPDVNQILVKTLDSINWISVFNEDNQLVFKLPIESNHLNLSLAGFDAGTYRIEFLLGNTVDVVSSRLLIK